MHVSKTANGRAAGCWANVRMHTPRVLRVKWGIWKTRYCLAGPSQVSYFRKSNTTAVPDQVVPCEGIALCEYDARIACLMRCGVEVAWLMHTDEAACALFIAAALPAVKDPAAFAPRHLCISGGSEANEWHSCHSLEQRQSAASQMQLEAVQAQLKHHETELQSLRDDPASSASAVTKHRRSAPGRGPRPKSVGSDSSSSDDDSVTSSIAGMVMDWPLSRAEKQFRLLQIMDREVSVTEKQNRRLRRQSLP